MDELRFSIMSAARFLVDHEGWHIVIFANDAAPFRDLPVEVVFVDDATVADWVGPQRYVWRGKIRMMAAAMALPDSERTIYVDGDTYFVRSPAELFSKLAPGVSLMHLREGRPPAPEVAALEHVLSRSEPVDSEGRPWTFGADRDSWNAGVVGLHASDAHLCREVELLTDQLLERGFNELSHTAEQLAFTVCLDQRTQLREARSVVRHYWPAEIREPFQPVLRSTLADPALTTDEKFERLWAARPRESATTRTKATVKRVARRVGVHL
ncbi:hypothetical protein [Modestobacter sp. SYSU DS0657]